MDTTGSTRPLTLRERTLLTRSTWVTVGETGVVLGVPMILVTSLLVGSLLLSPALTFGLTSYIGYPTLLRVMEIVEIALAISVMFAVWALGGSVRDLHAALERGIADRVSGALVRRTDPIDYALYLVVGPKEFLVGSAQYGAPWSAGRKLFDGLKDGAPTSVEYAGKDAPNGRGGGGWLLAIDAKPLDAPLRTSWTSHPPTPDAGRGGTPLPTEGATPLAPAAAPRCSVCGRVLEGPVSICPFCGGHPTF